jgi:hypothetical protein
LDHLLRPVIVDGQRLREPDAIILDLMSHFTVELYDLEPKSGRTPAGCWCSAPVLTGSFIFDWQTEAKELMAMTVGGPAVDGRRDRLAKDVNRHPRWSDGQVIAALNDAGARFGPDHKVEFLRTLPIEELKPFVGGEIDVVSAEFDLRYSGMNGTKSEADLSWIVHARWHASDGREAGCNLVFEPFEGKLKSFQRGLGLARAGGELRIGMEQRNPGMRKRTERSRSHSEASECQPK